MAGPAAMSALPKCARCGAVHHRSCWDAHGGCGSYNCAPARRGDAIPVTDAWRITQEDLDSARKWRTAYSFYSQRLAPVFRDGTSAASMTFRS